MNFLKPSDESWKTEYQSTIIITRRDDLILIGGFLGGLVGLVFTILWSMVTDDLRRRIASRAKEDAHRGLDLAIARGDMGDFLKLGVKQIQEFQKEKRAHRSFLWFLLAGSFVVCGGLISSIIHLSYQTKTFPEDLFDTETNSRTTDSYSNCPNTGVVTNDKTDHCNIWKSITSNVGDYGATVNAVANNITELMKSKVPENILPIQVLQAPDEARCGWTPVKRSLVQTNSNFTVLFPYVTVLCSIEQVSLPGILNPDITKHTPPDIVITRLFEFQIYWRNRLIGENYTYSALNYGKNSLSFEPDGYTNLSILGRTFQAKKTKLEVSVALGSEFARWWVLGKDFREGDWLYNISNTIRSMTHTSSSTIKIFPSTAIMSVRLSCASSAHSTLVNVNVMDDDFLGKKCRMNGLFANVTTKNLPDFDLLPENDVKDAQKHFEDTAFGKFGYQFAHHLDFGFRQYISTVMSSKILEMMVQKRKELGSPLPMGIRSDYPIGKHTQVIATSAFRLILTVGLLTLALITLTWITFIYRKRESKNAYARVKKEILDDLQLLSEVINWDKTLRRARQEFESTEERTVHETESLNELVLDGEQSDEEIL